MTFFLNRPQRVLTALALIALPGLCSAERIVLSTEDQARLGIVSQALDAAGSQSGMRVPAVVIPSPDTPSILQSRYVGVLQRWHQTGGAQLEAGDIVATLNSAELAQIQQQWLDASVELANQQAKLKRDRELFGEGIISRQRLEQTQRAYQQARFKREATYHQLQLAGFDTKALEALRDGQGKPGDYPLIAQQPGQLNRHFIRIGDQVAAGQTVATITSTQALWLRANVSAPLADGLALGQTLQATTGSQHASLILVSKNHQLNDDTQRVEILARFTEATDLRPGQSLSLVLSSVHSGVRVPASAVTHSGSITSIYLRNNEGFEKRDVQLTPLGADYLATDTLAPGDIVAVEGTAQLKGITLGLGGGE